MKNKHFHRGHRIDLFLREQNDGTWLCYTKIDDEWINKDESGPIHVARGTDKVDAKKKALAAAQDHINFGEKFEGN